MKIVSWNCQGLRPKRKELELYLREKQHEYNTALNETFLKSHMNFSLPGYDTKVNDRTWGQKRGAVFLNKVYDNNDFNIMTNNKTLATELELYKTILISATIQCPDGKPDRNLFRAITSFLTN